MLRARPVTDRSAFSAAMVAIGDFALGVLRQRRTRLRRLLLVHRHLDHDLVQISPCLKACIRARASIRRSLDCSRRVSAVAFNLNAFSSAKVMTGFICVFRCRTWGACPLCCPFA